MIIATVSKTDRVGADGKRIDALEQAAAVDDRLAEWDGGSQRGRPVSPADRE